MTGNVKVLLGAAAAIAALLAFRGKAKAETRDQAAGIAPEVDVDRLVDQPTAARAPASSLGNKKATSLLTDVQKGTAVAAGAVTKFTTQGIGIVADWLGKPKL